MISVCSLQLAILKTQMLMVDSFVKEDHASDAITANKKIFTTLFDLSSRSLTENIQSSSQNLESVFDEIGLIRTLISSLEVIRQIGAIEAARDEDIKSSFENYLTEMDQFNLRLRKSMAEIKIASESLVTSFATAEEVAMELATAVNDIFELATHKEFAA